jgi:hypothetical protein
MPMIRKNDKRLCVFSGKVLLKTRFEASENTISDV